MEGSCVITCQEIFGSPAEEIKDEQRILALLKEKGAPIKGITFLRLDDKYDFSRCDHVDNYSTTFSWRANGGL